MPATTQDDVTAALASVSEAPGASDKSSGSDSVPALGAEAAEPAPPPGKAVSPEPDDLSDERPWTPERIKAATEWIKKYHVDTEEFRKQAHKIWSDATAKANKFAKTKERHLSELQAARLEREQVNTFLRTMREGTVDQKLIALSQFAGRDGLEEFREWTEHAAGVKKSEPTQSEKRLEAELSAIKTELQRREERERIVEMDRAVTHWREWITAEVKKIPEHFPLCSQIAERTPDQFGEAIHSVKIAAYDQNKKVLDDGEALRILEEHLQKQRALFLPAQEAKPETTDSGSGNGRAPVQSRKSALSTPTKVTPSLATKSAGTVRALTEKESRQALLEEMPAEFWEDLGVR